MRILVACEFSGVVRRAFRDLGHDAWSCDLLPADDGSKYHYQDDIRNALSRGKPRDDADWDLMIAHPPCTYMANSGVSWLHRDPTRWEKLHDATEFFRLLWDAPIKRICIENPIMHKHAKERIGNLQQAQMVQPYMFGHLESKATCLWLKNLPLLVPTSNLKAETMALPAAERQRLHWLPPSADRWKLRSMTYPGIAAAMANQWGVLQ